MARLTESGAFTGARANPPRSRASFPGVVGPEEGKELAKLTWAARRIAPQRIGFRKGILTRFSTSVCYAKGVSQKVVESDSTNFSQCTGAQLFSRLPVDAIDVSRNLAATSILLLLERCHLLLGAADLRFSSASQGQKFLLTAEI